MDKSFNEIMIKFPKSVREEFERLPADILDNAEELRFRNGQPVMIASGGKEYFLEQQVNKEMLDSVINRLLDYSYYAYETELAEGYLTIEGGHRVGICGKTVIERGQVKLIKNISSLNIRRCREIKGISDKCINHVIREDGTVNNTLIVSPPRCGKTTLLRDLVRNLSERGFTVGVCDERSEIGGSCRGKIGFDLGSRTDVLDGCPKEQGIVMLLRSMAPQIIATDEIGKKSDVPAIETALCAGVKLLTTIHGHSLEDVKNSEIGGLVKKGIFPCVIILSNSPVTGHIKEVIYTGDF